MLIAVAAIFILGYAAIAFEHGIRINKSASALLTGVLCWTVYALSSAQPPAVTEQLTAHLGDLSGILFFLLGAMTVVELIDVHGGFSLLTDGIRQTGKRKLLWTLALVAFFLSPLLDNLTTAIVMVSVMRKLVKADDDRLLFAGALVIAANAGGAWSPIGDVTTTMLWIGGQITAGHIITAVFLPALASLVVPVFLLSARLRGSLERPVADASDNCYRLTKTQQRTVLFSGLLILLLVPVFKTVTHLPPYMGILIGLGVLWVITEIMHGSKPESERDSLSVSRALQRIDSPSILFFLGILLGVAALQSTGVLSLLAQRLSSAFGNDSVVVLLLGLSSSVVDNVPLVAAAQGMYPLAQYPTDHSFWAFLAYATGTGGSILIIGSAAGVAAMGLQNIRFFWYVKRISLPALAGYAAGAGVYLLQRLLF